MKQLKHYNRAKWIAALFAVLCGTAAFCMFLVVLFTNEMGLYQKTLSSVIKDHHEDLQKYYSIEIMDCRETGKALPDIPNMEYGILTSDSGLLQNVNVADTNNYVYTNFHETKPLDTSYIVQYADGYHVGTPDLLSSLTGNALGFVPDYDSIRGQYALISRIVYNKSDKLFYFEAGEHSFLISHISVESANTDTIPNFPKAKLRDHENFTFHEKSGKYESDSGHCRPLNTADYPNWTHLHCEGSQFYTKDIDTVSPEDMYQPLENATNITLMTDEVTFDAADFIENEDSGAESIDTETEYPGLYYEVPDTESKKTYWVVSNVKKEIDTSSGDFFAKQAVLLTKMYEYRYPFIGFTLLCSAGFVLALGCLCYIMKTAQREGVLPVLKWHKIPLLLYAGVMGTLILGCIWVIGRYGIRAPLKEINLYASCIFILFFALIGISLIVLLWMNLAVRYYGKVLWKYSVTRYFTSYVQKLVRIFQENTGLLVKGGIIFAAICLLELFCMMMTLWIVDGDSDMLFLDWILFKVISVPIFYIILIQMKHLQDGSKQLATGNLRDKLDTRKMLWEFKKHGEYLNQIGDGMSIALEERLRSERFKTELITNVSHDIRTPLTSIINYVDLLQKEDTAPEEQKEYLHVLEHQSARLKKLIEDLMEASKASTGTLPVDMEDCDVDILLTQTAGEYTEKLSDNQLELIIRQTNTPVHIQADNRHLWRIFDNLMNNICKYSQAGTRVYINQKADSERVYITFLNISGYALNISGDELMERFVRGDVSRNTEGSGLGLSIARSLTELMGGTLRIYIEGDLFKVVLAFPNA